MSTFEKKISSEKARKFLSIFDLNFSSLPSRKMFVLDFPSGSIGLDKLRKSFETLSEEENLPSIEIKNKFENEAAAKLVFLFLSEPKDLSGKVGYLTTYTSSENPIIWVLVKEQFWPRKKEKIPSIWEPLTNAQYYETRSIIQIDKEKWIGTKFTVGRKDSEDFHFQLNLSNEAQRRGSFSQ